jgi:tetratricopeptide (TPR) repeat protein
VDSNDLNDLTQEIEFLKGSQRYAECIQKMDKHAKQTVDPLVRAVLLTAKATCALQLGDIPVADSAASAIDTTKLTAAMKNYVDLTKATVAHEAGRLDEADQHLSAILASESLSDDEQRDVLYEALARRGFVQADKKQFGNALDLLQQATAIFGQGELRDNIGLYRGYCLQALGQLNEARESLKAVLQVGTGSLDADAYYRLGAVEMQDGDLSAAVSDFQLALTSLPRGRITRANILAAIGEAEKQSVELKRMNEARVQGKSRIQ